jgi:hypothetical protein
MALIRRLPRPPPSIPQVNPASENGATPPRGKSTDTTRQEVGEGERLKWRLGLAHFHNEYSFLMISSKLHDISLFFLLILSPL